MAKKNFLTNLGMTVSQPFRVGLLGGAQELGYTIGDLLEAYRGELDTSRPKNYFGLTEEESKRLYKDPLKTGVKSAAGVMSWAVPGGSTLKGAQGIGQAALRGMGSGALSGLSYSEEGKELEGTMGGAALGGAIGGGLQAVSQGMGALTGKRASMKGKTNSKLVKGSASKLDMSPEEFTDEVKNLLDDMSQRGYKVDSSKDIANSMKPYMDEVQKEIAKSGLTSKYSPDISELKTIYASAKPHISGSKGVSSKFVELSDEFFSKSKPTVTDVLKYKEAIDSLGGGYSAVQDGKPFLAQTMKAIRNESRSLLTDDTTVNTILEKASRAMKLKPTILQNPEIADKIYFGGILPFSKSVNIRPMTEKMSNLPNKIGQAVLPGEGLTQGVQSLAGIGQRAVPAAVGMSAQPGQEELPQESQAPLGTSGMMGTEQVDLIGQELQKMGFGGQQQGSQQIDWQGLTMELTQAVMSGQMSSSEADWILNMLQQSYGGQGGEQDFATQLEELAQVDKREASNYLARAVANGEVNTTTANTLSRLYGLSAPAQSATAALDTADLIANETEKMLESLNLGDNELLSAVGGTARTLYGKTVEGSEAGQYIQWIEGARTKIARALGEVGNLSEPEQIAAMKLMPTLKDTKQSAANKLARFRRLIDGARKRMRGEYVPDMSTDISRENSISSDYMNY